MQRNFFEGGMGKEACNLSCILTMDTKKMEIGLTDKTKEIFLASGNLSFVKKFVGLKKYHQ